MQIGEEDIENLFLTMEKDLWKYTKFLFIFHFSLFENQINIFQFEAIVQKGRLMEPKVALPKL
jgi:hypothetical protein